MFLFMFWLLHTFHIIYKLFLILKRVLRRSSSNFKSIRLESSCLLFGVPILYPIYPWRRRAPWNICWLAPKGALYLTPVQRFPSIHPVQLSRHDAALLHLFGGRRWAFYAKLRTHHFHSQFESKRSMQPPFHQEHWTQENILWTCCWQNSVHKLTFQCFFCKSFWVPGGLFKILLHCTGATCVERVLNSGGCVSICQTLTPVTP